MRYKWRILPGVEVTVDEEKAKRLSKIGEHVNPNPNTNWKKYPYETIESETRLDEKLV